MEQKGFVKELFSLLQAQRFPFQNLCLELTERGELEHMKRLNDTFSLLRRCGLKIAIDDFGTGTAALHLLQIHVCLEGVENQEQLQYLSRFPAEIHQGYYYGKPMQRKEFLALL